MVRTKTQFIQAVKDQIGVEWDLNEREWTKAAKEMMRGGPWMYVRLRPNPGFRIGSFHWCKARGRHREWIQLEEA